MATRTDITITGAREMEKLLQQLGPEVATRVGRAAVRAGAVVVAREAARLAPVDEGKLRDSIMVKTLGAREERINLVELINVDFETGEVTRAGSAQTVTKERLVTAVVGFERPTSRRAHLVEFGTTQMAAQPFMRPAMDTKAAEALDTMGKVLARGIARAARQLASPKN